LYKAINLDDLRKILKHTRSASPDAQLAEAGLQLQVSEIRAKRANSHYRAFVR